MPVWEKHALPRDASQGSQSPPPRLEAPSLGSPSPVVPLLTQGCLEQGLFIDTVLSSLPLPEETAPGGDGPDLTALVDIPTGTVLSGNQRLLGIPPVRGAGRGTPTVAVPEHGGDGTTQLWPLPGPHHLWVGRVSPQGAPHVPDGRQLLFPVLIAGLPRLPRSKVAAHMRQYSYGPN